MTDPVERPEAETTALEVVERFRQSLADDIQRNPHDTIAKGYVESFLYGLVVRLRQERHEARREKHEAEKAGTTPMTDPVERPEAETTAADREFLRLWAENERNNEPWLRDSVAELLRDLARAEASANEATAERDAYKYNWDLAEAECAEAADLIREATAERDAAIARAERLAGALKAVEPYIETIVCYASTINEHDGNRIAALVHAALTEPDAKGGGPAPVPATTEKTDD